jgi:tetratricopeptide (TPR) repeat protein
MHTSVIAFTLTLTLLAATVVADDKTDCATSDNHHRVITACSAVLANAGDDTKIQAEALTNRGSAKYGLQDFDGAIADLDEAIRLNPNLSAAFFNRGTASYRKNDAKRAMADFNEAIRLDPKDLKPLINRGVLYFDLDENAHAIADMDAAIKLAPKQVGLYAYRAKMYLDSGDVKHAAADFKRVLELDPSNEEAKAMLRDLGVAK